MQFIRIVTGHAWYGHEMICVLKLLHADFLVYDSCSINGLKKESQTCKLPTSHAGFLL